MGTNFKDLTGNKYGRLTVLCPVEQTTKSRSIRWLCVCDCGEEKSVSSYHLTSGKINSCGCLRLSTAKDKAKIVLETGLKVCSTCEIEKLAEGNFYKNISSRDGFHSICKKCSKINYEKKYLKNSYGITRGEYLEIIKDQKGLCPVCLQIIEPFKATTHVDHNHKTGRVRGILHFSCNVLLGLAKDNPTTLLNAITYLSK